VASQGFQKVGFTGVTSERQASLRGSLALSHAAWAGVGGARAFHRERVDAGVRARDLFWDGFDLTGDLSAMGWTQRGARSRFRPNTDAQLYVWEASVRYRRPDAPVAFELGRIRPRFVPGLTRLDGAQIGWRPDPTTEVGLFGGVLPDLVTSEPAWQRWTVGAYATTDVYPADEVVVSGTLRANYLRLLDDAQRFGTGAEVRAQVGGWLRLGSEISISLAMAPAVDLQLDHWSVDFTLQPMNELSIFGSARHLGADSSFGGFENLGLDPAGGTRADLGAQWQLVDWLDVGVNGGALHDAELDLTRGYVGPEVRFVQVFPGRTSLAVGYIGEVEVQSGHTAYVQTTSLPMEGLRIWARLAYTMEAEALPRPRELLLSTYGQWEALDWLALRLSLFGHAGLISGGPQWGLGGTFTLTGTL